MKKDKKGKLDIYYHFNQAISLINQIKINPNFIKKKIEKNKKIKWSNKIKKIFAR